MNLDPIVPLLLIVVTSIALAITALLRSKIPGGTSLAILALALALWSSAYLIELKYPLPGSERAGIAIVFLSMTVAASAQFVFCLTYTRRTLWVSRLSTLLLSVMPVLSQVLYWLRPTHDLFFSGWTQQLLSPLPLEGIWARLSTIYIYSLIGASVLVLLETFGRKPRTLFLRSWPIPILGSAVPFLVEMMNAIGLRTAVAIDPSLFSFTLAGIGFSYGLFNQSLIESVPVTREKVVEGMNDGWMVLNAQKLIVDTNPAAERMIGIPRDKAYGQPLSAVLGDLPNLGKIYEGVQELEMKRSFKSHEGWRYLNIRISGLSDDKDEEFGHLIVWRDITDRRLAEDARQRARDEMFVLLNAISSEASQAMNLEDFLAESIYQIIYPFQSQVVGIFLADEKNQQGPEQSFVLTSHFGLPAEVVESMPCLSASSGLLAPVLESRQPLLIEDPAGDPQLPAPLREIGSACMLIVPLITPVGDENRILGCMCVARKEGPAYTQDELVRLATIGDHLANLIDSERRRKLAIALSERQRLMRDLHDSVSQKLYGLVTLTEAAQAALEAGNTVDPSQVLSKIGDNARQAVKEMRLFLYQMQSVDLEKDGLISVLHHRLSAVEGRADMKARLLADEHISLSTDKEIALYFIAQEALNNILRHARAKNVLVTLKQGRKNVILEIQDDGRGFDTKKVDVGGLGLANMRERASKIGGKLKIITKPEQGTKVVVTVARSEPVIQPRHRR